MSLPSPEATAYSDLPPPKRACVRRSLSSAGWRSEAKSSLEPVQLGRVRAPARAWQRALRKEDPGGRTQRELSNEPDATPHEGWDRHRDWCVESPYWRAGR